MRDTVPDIVFAFLLLLNADRASNGQAALMWDEALAPIAQQRAEQVCTSSGWTHYLSDGRLAVTALVKDAGEAYAILGENLARGPVTFSPERAEMLLLASPGHRANITDQRFTSVAIGRAEYEARVCYTQVFRG